jgi:hypothetical protein
LFKTLQAQSRVCIRIEAEDVFHGLEGSMSVIENGFNLEQTVTRPEWRSFMRTWVGASAPGAIRRFGEGLDEAFIRMRMLAIWEAQETMDRKG